MAPETRYAKNGDVWIAYQVIGQGQIDLVFVPGFVSNLEIQWEDAGFAHLVRRLATFSRLIMFDKRGTGLSDRVDARGLPSLETRVEDIRAVMDASGSGRAVLLGASDGAAMSLLFAATYPARVRALVLFGGYSHLHSGLLGREGLEHFIRDAEEHWGSGASVARFAPEKGRDERFKAWWARHERLGASPGGAVSLARMNAQIDVRPVLAALRVPTLLLHRKDDAWVRPAASRELAERIAGARRIELSGRDHLIWSGDVDAVVDEIEAFLTGVRPVTVHERVLASLVIARLVDPERWAARLGDREWRARLERLNAIWPSVVARFHGQPIAAGGDSLRAHFDGPARAVRCAVALREAAHGSGLELAAGVHTGEVELRAGVLGGLAVHVTERIAAAASAGEVLVSGIVTELVAGSGLHFVERGAMRIEGVNAPLRLLAVMNEQHLEPATRAPNAPDLGNLSTREREVLALVADGLSNPAIAERLRLSEHTVKRHIANILLKLDLPTRAAAAALLGRARPPRGL